MEKDRKKYDVMPCHSRPIILNGTKEELENLFGCDIEKLRLAIIISEREFKEMKRQKISLEELEKNKEMVEKFRNQIVNGDLFLKSNQGDFQKILKKRK